MTRPQRAPDKGSQSLLWQARLMWPTTMLPQSPPPVYCYASADSDKRLAHEVKPSSTEQHSWTPEDASESCCARASRFFEWFRLGKPDDHHQRNAILDRNLPPVGFTAFCKAMTVYRAKKDDSRLQKLFQHRQRSLHIGGNSETHPDCEWAWHIKSEARVRDGRAIIEIRYRLETREGLDKLPSDLLKGMSGSEGGSRQMVVYADMLEKMGCIHVPKSRYPTFPPFRRELYADFAVAYDTENCALRENIHIGTCIWCNAEIFTSVRRACCDEIPSFNRGDDRVFEVVRYLDLGEGLPSDVSRWEANTVRDRKARLSELWDLRKLFDQTTTEEISSCATENALRYELSQPYGGFLKAVRAHDVPRPCWRFKAPANSKALKCDQPPLYRP